MNLTFGETNEVTAGHQPQELREEINSLKQKIISLQKELERVKADAKLEGLVDSKYQIYFREPKTQEDVLTILRECVAAALDRKCLRADQPCKVELV